MDEDDTFISPPSSPLRVGATGARTPFLIGVAGGTASGKVRTRCMLGGWGAGTEC